MDTPHSTPQPQRPRTTLPPTPTLEQQGSNVATPRQPIVFRSSDIHPVSYFNDNNATPVNSSSPTSSLNHRVSNSSTASSVPPSSVSSPNQPPITSNLSNATATAPSSAAFLPNSPAAPVVPVTPAPVQPTPRPPRLMKPTQPVGTKTVAELPKPKRQRTINRRIARRIIISISVVVLVMITGFIAIAIVNSNLSSGYGATYRLARELSTRLTAARQSPGCTDVVSDLTLTTVASVDYDADIASCRDTLTGIGPLVDQLAESSGVRWSPDIAASYEALRSQYYEYFPDQARGAEMSTWLDYYQAWHTYLVSSAQLSPDSSEEEFRQTAEPLLTSSSETLTSYGEGWFSRELAYITSYRQFHESTPSPEREQYHREMDQNLRELETYIRESQPDLPVLFPIATPDPAPVIQSFNAFYEQVKRAYVQYYDHKSGDCDVNDGTVYCK